MAIIIANSTYEHTLYNTTTEEYKNEGLSIVIIEFTRLSSKFIGDNTTTPHTTLFIILTLKV